VNTAPRDHLIVFTRWPEPGATKTRLIPAMGAAGAAALQRRMTQHMLRTTDRLAAAHGVHVEVRFTGGDADRMTACFGAARHYEPQGEGDLGARLERAIQEALAAGAQRVCVVGTDCPAIDADLLRRAFESLEEADVVIGPAEDGGYYLLGMRSARPALFDRIPWSTDRVLETTLRAAEAEHLSVARLPVLRDIDRPEDLEHARAMLAGALSIVVPTRNEAARLAATLDAIRSGGDAEVLVVDGGSHDETTQIAASRGARVLHGPVGRAAQMNAGARAASGSVLLFCHADTHLPAGYEGLVRAALDREGAVLGAFDLALRGEERALRRIERGVRWRSRTRRLPYGDQALFLRRSVFERLGGYADLPIMEDYDLVVRARRLGRVVIAAGSASTSARFWREHGMLRGTLRNHALVLGWRLGVAPQTLARWRRAR